MTGPNEEPAHGWHREAGLAHRSSERRHSSGNSAAAQRQRMLGALQSCGTVSTIEARRDHDILAPAARVHELRHKHGHRIETVWTEQATDCGKVHRVALYVLRHVEPHREAA